MILSTTIKEAKFLVSKDELTYREVLDEFSKANKIFILTYNISSKSNELLKALKQCGEHTEVKIISNLPGRWKEYFNDSYSKKARRNISIYKNKLNPEKISEKAQVYFCFANHAKIIMTDNIAYVGSANFSEESSENFEAGFISRDKNFIKFLENDIFPWIIEYSSEYGIDNKVLFLKTAISKSIVMFDSIYEKFHMSFYSLADHRGQELWFYNTTDNIMSINDIEDSIEICNKYLELLEEINGIFENKNIVEAGIEDINDLIENSNNIVNSIQQIFYERLYDLAIFNKQDYIDEYINNNSAEAYDENLEYYIEEAMDIADEAFEKLAEEVKDDADELLRRLESMKNISRLVLNRFNEIPQNIIKIDNTD